MELEGKILKWLDEGGYPLEMRIARSLSLKEFDVTQSHYFTDFESETAREIDVIGRLYSYIEPDDYVAIAELETFITVECKSTPNPWVIFCETKPALWKMQQALCNKSGETLLNRSYREISKTKLYLQTQNAGHGVAQAFGGKTDLPYAAMMSAFKAAEGQARESRASEKENEENEEYSDICESASVIPVVVITAPLFECYLGDNEKPLLREVQSSSVAFRYPAIRSRIKAGTIVHVVTEQGWQEFEESIKEFHTAVTTNLKIMIPPDNNA